MNSSRQLVFDFGWNNDWPYFNTKKNQTITLH